MKSVNAYDNKSKTVTDVCPGYMIKRALPLCLAHRNHFHLSGLNSPIHCPHTHIHTHIPESHLSTQPLHGRCSVFQHQKCIRGKDRRLGVLRQCAVALPLPSSSSCKCQTNASPPSQSALSGTRSTGRELSSQ